MSFYTDNTAILLATYNGEKYIAQQLDSILAQTEPAFELFIHDDGSSDATPAIIGRYAAEHPGRIHILEAPSCKGAKNNFLYLMGQVSAPYIMFCDQDDVWLPDKLQRSLSAIKALEAEHGSQKPLLVFSDAAVVDADVNVVADSFFRYQGLSPDRLRFPELMVQNVVSGNVALFNRALLEAAGKYRNAEHILMHDWWCVLVAAYFGAVGLVEGSTVLYRQHGGNTVGAKKSQGLAYIRGMLRQSHEIKASLLATRVQAGEFADAFQLSPESLPARYARIGDKSKAARLLFYARNGIRKSGLLRNVGLYFFG